MKREKSEYVIIIIIIIRAMKSSWFRILSRKRKTERNTTSYTMKYNLIKQIITIRVKNKYNNLKT